MGKRLRDVLIFAIFSVAIIAIVYLSRASSGVIPVSQLPSSAVYLTNKLTPVKRTTEGRMSANPTEAPRISRGGESGRSYELYSE